MPRNRSEVSPERQAAVEYTLLVWRLRPESGRWRDLGTDAQVAIVEAFRALPPAVRRVVEDGLGASPVYFDVAEVLAEHYRILKSNTRRDQQKVIHQYVHYVQVNHPIGSTWSGLPDRHRRELTNRYIALGDAIHNELKASFGHLNFSYREAANYLGNKYRDDLGT